MTLNEYQQLAMNTCQHKSKISVITLPYLACGVLKLGDMVTAYIRKGYATIDGKGLHLNSQGDDDAAWDREYDLRMATGDVLRQLSVLCAFMGWELDDIARASLEKLADP